MKEIASCCEGDYRVGPVPKVENQPEVVFTITSMQHEQQKQRETQNGN